MIKPHIRRTPASKPSSNFRSQSRVCGKASFKLYLRAKHCESPPQKQMQSLQKNTLPSLTSYLQVDPPNMEAKNAATETHARVRVCTDACALVWRGATLSVTEVYTQTNHRLTCQRARPCCLWRQLWPQTALLLEAPRSANSAHIMGKAGPF